MRIINETKWKTEHLREFVRRIVPNELDPEKRKGVVIRFVNARNRGVSGWAYRNSRRCRIIVPKPGSKIEHLKEALAKVIAHELAHLQGRPGGRSSELNMRGSDRYGYRGDYVTYYAWAKELPLEPQEEQHKAKPATDDKYAVEIARMEKLMSGWERRKKRAETAIKKYARKIKYRQGRLAACRSTKAE